MSLSDMKSNTLWCCLASFFLFSPVRFFVSLFDYLIFSFSICQIIWFLIWKRALLRSRGNQIAMGVPNSYGSPRNLQFTAYGEFILVFVFYSQSWGNNKALKEHVSETNPPPPKKKDTDPVYNCTYAPALYIVWEIFARDLAPDKCFLWSFSRENKVLEYQGERIRDWRVP